ncbi:MAG: type phosphodiesterase/nucleotide pyrophosphatase [Paenibacillus sp.]|jgi:predicted AlkP superfamily pyrophosphatase or phosphodiesterase|nr:type phosphodiesterase/nucleotide pyrophosphatase [Paenibacillus sp.]
MLQQQSGDRTQHIMIISIDGMAHYYLEEPRLHIPHLRSLIEQGTVAKMESIFPTSTWAVHTSLTTGTYPRRHGVLGNWVIRRSTGEVGEYFGDSTYSKNEAIHVKTIYDAAKQIGWSTASICWPMTRGAESLDYNIPEFYKQELFEQFATHSLWEELKEAGLPVHLYGDWSKDYNRGHMQDWLTTEVAKYLLKKHRPNFLQLHYLLPDTYQHGYGILSPEVLWSLEYIDERIGELITELRAKNLWENTTLFVVSDHGFVNTTKTFYPNVLFQRCGWYNPDQPELSSVVAVSNGGSGFVYVLETDKQRKLELLKRSKEELLAQGVIRKLFLPEDFPALGLPGPGEMDDQRPDFAFEAEKDVFVHFNNTGDQVLEQGAKFFGMHGYLPDHEEMKCIFIAAGKGIPVGVRLPEIRAVDVAPTLAKLMGCDLNHTDGEAIDFNVVNEGSKTGSHTHG